MLLHEDCRDLEALLLQSAKEKNYEGVSQCIESGAYVNCQDDHCRTPLSFLCTKSKSSFQNDDDVKDELRARIAKLLIDSGANVEQDFFEPEYSVYMTPLHAAVYFQNRAVMDLLLNYGYCDVNARASRDDSGFTALHWAVADSDCNLNIVEGLLKAMNIDVNAKCYESGNTPLHLAMMAKHAIELVELLRVYGADVSVLNHKGRTAVQEYMANVMGLRTDRLYFRGIEPSLLRAVPLSEFDTSPLHLASIFHRTSQISKLTLKMSEQEVNAVDIFGYTPLFYAVLARGPAQEKNSTVRLLLNRGAYVSKKFSSSHEQEEGHYGILDLAILLDDKDVCRILLQHIAKLLETKSNVSEFDLELIYWNTAGGENSDLWKYFLNCQKELREMKERKVEGSKLSLFELITADRKQSRIYARNKSLVEAFEIGMRDEAFPIYEESIFYTTFRETVEHRKLVESAAYLLSDVLEFADYTHIFYEKTLSHFDSEELRFLLDSAT